ncbi:hypothetical protein KL864_21200 [Mycolicibacterium goodii]|uniref:hypothetical protein n=1 Tax=Mycolicibacterium goodii TaxID=134601 RepID=UPI001BDCC7BA|nr:hypothetical protein [Mycolicibacterium goodii]MBU8818422.1 hypothetical protein [Mycolicibacterium goodii]
MTPDEHRVSHSPGSRPQAGSANQAVWVAAQRHGVAVQPVPPVPPVLRYADDDRELRELPAGHAAALRDLQYAFRALRR